MRCALLWRHNKRDGVSNHQRLDYVFNGLFRSMKTSKFRVTGVCAQRASNAENVSILWRHHGQPMTLNRYLEELPERGDRTSSWLLQMCWHQISTKPSVTATGLRGDLGVSWIVLNKSRYNWHMLTLIPTWISNYMPSKVWDEITYHSHGLSVKVWEWICNYIHYKVVSEITHPFPNFNGWTTLYWTRDYLSMLGSKLINVSKRGHRNMHSSINLKFANIIIWLSCTSNIFVILYL